MAKSVPESVMDKILEEIATSDQQDVVSDSITPTDLTNSLANTAMTPGDGGDYTFAEGDAGAGSRKVTMSAKSNVTVTAAGTPNHVVLSLSGVIKLITTCTGPDLTVDSKVNFPSWKYEIGIPS